MLSFWVTNIYVALKVMVLIYSHWNYNQYKEHNNLVWGANSSCAFLLHTTIFSLWFLFTGASAPHRSLPNALIPRNMLFLTLAFWIDEGLWSPAQWCYSCTTCAREGQLILFPWIKPTQGLSLGWIPFLDRKMTSLDNGCKRKKQNQICPSMFEAGAMLSIFYYYYFIIYYLSLYYY